MDSELRSTADTDLRSASTFRYDETDGPTATVAVIDAVADAADTDPTTLPPLYHVVDPDALDALFDGRNERGAESPLRIEFSYNGFDVVVRDGPEVVVEPAST
ncbi:HalOD1 output domain-containing protein [Halopiger djelfimassiliensis]|uniref:HalOD1 output domain-containing protein n=1 Tax=Halopiger djelfimassiliensis TaxID=1293047 RepID=UPI0006782273|nr:HalOD1 output domain-containing protein [Halopiger djelfimassiliensis]